MFKRLRMAAYVLAFTAVCAAPFAVQAASKDKDENPVVATVDGAKIYRSDVVRELQNLGPQAQQIPGNVLYGKLLEKVIVTKLVSDKGYAMKLQSSEDVKERMKQAETQFVADAYIHKMVQPKITEAKIKKRYDELKSKFKPQDEVRARHILVQDESEAKDIIKKIKDGADFSKLAMEKSKDSGSAKQGGDLGYFTRDTMVKPFADAAFSMKIGEISQAPVKTDFGYHIIKIEDRRKSSAPPLSEVEGQIRSQIGQEMVQDLIESMVKKAKIKRFDIDGKPLKEEKK